MSEDFLHFVWQYQLFEKSKASPVIEVKHPGVYNHHEGPDFMHAQLIYNDMEWRGHVEIHLKSSDWKKHQHDANQHYQNIILHVVYEEDMDLNLSCPTLVLKDLIHPNIQDQYIRWLKQSDTIACAHSGIVDIMPLFRIQWIDRLIVERCEMRYDDWLITFQQLGGDWRQMMWVKLAESMGMKYNNVGMKNLALTLSIVNIEKLGDDEHTLEAYLFGTSGLLPLDLEDDYTQRLQQTFSFLEKKYPVEHPIKIPWNFLRMRPANFPTIRIAQLVQLLMKGAYFWSTIMSKKTTLADLYEFLNVGVSDYWKEHYVFYKSSKRVEKHLGKTAIESIIINAIIPLHYFHGKYYQDKSSISKAFNLYQELKAEKNSIIDQWIALNHVPENAYESQAYLHLYKQYCMPRRCAACQFGQKILKSKV